MRNSIRFRRCSRSKPFALLAILAALLPGAATAAVPGQVNYQGLLLDDLGAPINGSVAMTFDLFDALTAGTSLWSESHPSVTVTEGIYHVALGSVTPIDAATLAGGSVFLEISVDGETLAPRQQLLAVPYAVRAAVAETAESVPSIDGVPDEFVSQLFLHTNFDGGPPNDDPREGFADTDNDGTLNFIDSDNDDDGLTDTVEVAQGSDINAVTPTIGGFAPPTADGFVTTAVTLSGTTFDPGVNVAFGSENPTAYDITPTSLKVDVGPQPPGTVGVTVTHSNGESANATFDFFYFDPIVTAVDPFIVDEMTATTLTVTGQNFVPGLTVQIGTQTPTPTNITPTSFDVLLAAEPPSTLDMTVTLPTGRDTTVTGAITVAVGAPRTLFVTSGSYPGSFGDILQADATCQTLANTAGLSGTFQAWLSDSTQSPSTRSTQAGQPYRDAVGGVVANDWADLTDGVLSKPINLNETGAFVSGSLVWTNTAPDGTVDGSEHCADWSDGTSGSSGGYGSSSSPNSNWTDLSTTTCDVLRRLYCIQQ